MTVETQRESWEKTREHLGDKQAMVFGTIRDASFGRTLFELARILGWPINSISGRVTELKKLGRIRDSGVRRSNPDTGKRAVVWIQDDHTKGQMDLLEDTP